MNIVEKLVLFCLFTFLLIMSGLFMFANHLVVVFPGTELDPMVMAEWRTRTIQPAFYMTACYFILRHFLGKNPTTTLWPVFLILYSLLLLNHYYLLIDHINLVYPG